MKIEMGESLFYSWLRHVKACQIVQTNWKISTQWTLQHEIELSNLMKTADKHFNMKYGYKIFRQNRSLFQIIQQGECDAIGISVENGVNHFYAVDVAFHGGGLNYGTREETVMKVIAKGIRTAICLYGYMGTKNAEIIFAAPKIYPAILNDLAPCIEDVNAIFKEQNFDFTMRVIANEDFNHSVLQPILLVSDGIADTSELFIRSYQIFTMFTDTTSKTQSAKKIPIPKEKPSDLIDYQNACIYKELKIGKLAQIVLRRMLEDGFASEEEIGFMQQPEYSKQFFDLNYPLLVPANSEYDSLRYYVAPLIIRGVAYMMCSQWFETSTNNDRPYLMKWIEKHQQ